MEAATTTALIPDRCTCTRPGHCPRFGREMPPRDFNDCRRRDRLGAEARVRFAAGTERGDGGAGPTDGAMALAEVPALSVPRPSTPIPCPLILGNRHCPGDVLVMTAAIESLHRAHPGRYRTGVQTTCDAIFEHNPRVEQVPKGLPESKFLDLEYPLINRSNQEPRHFLEGYCLDLQEKLGVPVPLAVNRPLLYLSDDEKRWVNQVQEIAGKPTKFWLVNAGFKFCYTTKAWAHEHYQDVIDRTAGRIQWVQVGSADRGHEHKPLRGAINLVGKTDARQLIRLAWHAQGGIGPSTFLQHVMAAHGKPYVCIHRAAEPLTWIAYPNQIVISRLGSLPCCADKACWKSRTVPLGDGKDASLCEHPVFGLAQPEPRCLALIRPEEVVRAVESYYEGGVLTY